MTRCLTCFWRKRTARMSRRFISSYPVCIKLKAGPPMRNRKCGLTVDCSVKQVKLSQGKQVMPSTSRARLIKTTFRTSALPVGLLLILIALPMYAASQEQMSSQQGGASTGGVYAPVHDAEYRPITAGGFVDQGPIVFKDVSQAAGLTTWRSSGGTPPKAYIVESLGS